MAYFDVHVPCVCGVIALDRLTACMKGAAVQVFHQYGKHVLCCFGREGGGFVFLQVGACRSGLEKQPWPRPSSMQVFAFRHNTSLFVHHP